LIFHVLGACPEGGRVYLDEDLPEMYGVETHRLNEQVKRNIERFLEDFMFQLNELEYENLKSQNASLGQSEKLNEGK
jgi:hypothetical protein